MLSGPHSKTVEHNGVDYEVTYWFHPGRPAVNYLRNGDPGYPEEPPYIEIERTFPETPDQNILNDIEDILMGEHQEPEHVEPY